jgi:IS30 family transposase
VYTITFDNGCKFSEHIKLGKALPADIYFAHPYPSWKRSLNENFSNLLRQYIPKGTVLKAVRTETKIDTNKIELKLRF